MSVSFIPGRMLSPRCVVAALAALTGAVSPMLAQSVPVGPPGGFVQPAAAVQYSDDGTAVVASSGLRPGAAELRPAANQAATAPAAADDPQSGITRLPPLSTPEELPRASATYGARTLPATGNEPKMLPAPVEPTDMVYPINLATALRLSDARPVMVTAAQAATWVAEARLQRAWLLKIPEFDFGACYVRHDGYGPDFNHGLNEPTFISGLGGPLNQNLNWMYIGGSFYMIEPLTDIIFQPLAARQVLDSKRFDVQAAKNDALRDTAVAYFEVHRSRGQYAGATDVVQRGEKLVERITHLSQDLVPRVEIDRAVNMVAIVQQQAALARQEWRVASANLTQTLRLDPRVLVVPQEPDHLQVTLIDVDRPLDELMPMALVNRPELASQKALVNAAATTIRQEKMRPLLPEILITGFQSPSGMRMQGMIFGLGPDKKMDLWSLRDDVSLQAVWTLSNMGFGNLTRIKEQRGTQSRAIVRLNHIQDEIVADVNQRQADLQSAAVRVIEAERALRRAIATYDGNYQGLAQTRRFGNLLVQVYRPQEAVAALERLMDSYNQYFATVADYNIAQFQLFHALGYPAREVAMLRPAGEIAPVDTNRPEYLPPVGVGPPPATR